MENTDSKIHKLEAKPGRITPVDEPPASEQIRYVVAPEYAGFHYPEEDSIDLLALWRILSQSKGILITTFLTALMLAAGIALFSTPIFRAELIMAPAAEEKKGGLSALSGQFGGLASLAGINLSSGGTDVNRTLATLKSRRLLAPFLEQNKIIPQLFKDKWDEAKGTWRADLNDDAPTVLQAYEYFKERVFDLRQDSKTGLVTLGIEWEDPMLAAQWANQLVARLNEHQRQVAITEAQQSIEYLNEQLEETDVVEMQQAIYRLIEAQAKVIMLANVKQEYAMQVIDSAVAPEESVRPQRALILVLGIVLGLMAGIFIVFVRHAIQSMKLKTPPVSK